MRGIIYLALFGGSLLLLSGCWDRVEVNDLAIITAAAIDKKEDDRIELSLQVFIPRAMSSGGGQGGGGGSGEPVTFVSSYEGKNLAEALSKLQTELPRKVFWGHCHIFIFGEEVAREGIQDHLDFLLRHPQPRERAFVFVSDGKARPLTELQTRLENFSAETIRRQANLGVGLKTTMQKLDEMLASEAQAAALPFIKLSTEKGTQSDYQYPHIVGTAVFKKDKMVGTLSLAKTRGVIWLKNEIEEYTVTLKPKNIDGDISLNPVSTHVAMIPHIYNDEWEMDVNIRTEGAVVQNGTTMDLTNPSSIRLAEIAFQKDIKHRIESTIHELQQELDTDILDFAKEFHHKYPKHWRSVKNRWDEIFPQVKVNVNVKGNIRRQGNINESVKSREER